MCACACMRVHTSCKVLIFVTAALIFEFDYAATPPAMNFIIQLNETGTSFIAKRIYISEEIVNTFMICIMRGID
jgi:hypothetical protein